MYTLSHSHCQSVLLLCLHLIPGKMGWVTNSVLQKHVALPLEANNHQLIDRSIQEKYSTGILQLRPAECMTVLSVLILHCLNLFVNKP